LAGPALAVEFSGTKGRLFGLAFRTGLLTVLTLGIYRFWMKTRLRRYLWSSVRPGGHPLEYTGEPLEKLLGFLIAVVALAFYIGVVNLVLMWGSLAWLNATFAAYAISFVGVLPLVFFAQYRARRYLLARTRWRGIRFGLEPGAWAYALRAFWHWGLTIASLGFLWPRMTFHLEKFRTDRTWFGDRRLTQGGDWRMLYPPFKPFLYGVIGTGLISLAARVYDNEAILAGLFLTVPLILFGLVHYRVQAFRLLTDHKSAGGIGFRALPRTGRVLGIYAGGLALVYLVLVVLLILAAVLAGIAAVGALRDTADTIDILRRVEALPRWLAVAGAVAAYFAAFLVWGTLRQVLITLPILRHYAETLTLTGALDIPAVRQRDADAATEAGGFAEALDVGASL
jgi:uncharacterized membrane protein YjgN (DUF898 family)